MKKSVTDCRILIQSDSVTLNRFFERQDRTVCRARLLIKSLRQLQLASTALLARGSWRFAKKPANLSVAGLQILCWYVSRPPAPVVQCVCFAWCRSSEYRDQAYQVCANPNTISKWRYISTCKNNLPRSSHRHALPR